MNLKTIEFKVDETPYAIWGKDTELRTENIEFIEGIDVEYFRFQLNLFYNELENESQSKNAALSIRHTYYHIAETFFSLLAATLQCPFHVLGWMTQYQNKELRSLIKKINLSKNFYNTHNLTTFSWKPIVELIHRTNEINIFDQEYINFFATLWMSAAEKHIANYCTYEYNSMKHGFRGKFGSSQVKFDGKDLNSGKFGTSYKIPNSVNEKTKFHFYLSHGSTHWNPKKDFAEAFLLTTSIINLKAFLTPYYKKGSVTVDYEVANPELIKMWKTEINPEVVSVIVEVLKIKIDQNNLATKKEILDRLI